MREKRLLVQVEDENPELLTFITISVGRQFKLDTTLLSIPVQYVPDTDNAPHTTAKGAER